MDIISFNEAATANGRIEKFSTNPDSNSGVLTQPKVIEAGETVTIKSGRQAILADTVVDGDLVIEAGGEVFVPAGAGFSDLDQRVDRKLDKDFSSFTDKPTPDDTDNFALQEVGGDLKKVTYENLTKLSPNDSRVKTALNASGAAPIYACRAWVNFNGTGTVAIRASGNVSSITDNGIGLYGINFINNMPDVNYSVSGTGQYSNDGVDNGVGVSLFIRRNVNPLQLSYVDVLSSYGTTVHDASIVAVSIFR